MRKVIAAIVLGISIVGIAGTVSAGEIDLLINKLVEKGVLSPGEGQQILIETKEEVKKNLATGSSDIVPQWVQNLKFKGDFRVRYQQEDRKASSSTRKGRNRGRIRVRLGAEAKVNDKAKVYIGLATGSTDSRSTNQTMENSFELKDIRLDYAYAEVMLNNFITAYAGRMKNPLWLPSDLFWDGDINPEGGALKALYKVSPELSLFANFGVFVLDENSSYTSAVNKNTQDPFMIVIQPGFKLNVNAKTSLTAAVAYYNFTKDKGYAFDQTQSSNSTVTGAGLQYSFDSVHPSFELKVLEPFTGLGFDLPMAGLFGEYVYNFDPDKGNTGFLAGIKFGHDKVSGWKQWQAKVMYRYLGKDSVLDIFPDSDMYSGKTNVKGIEGTLSFGLTKNMTLDLDYYHTQLISGTENPENIMQVDFNFKF